MAKSTNPYAIPPEEFDTRGARGNTYEPVPILVHLENSSTAITLSVANITRDDMRARIKNAIAAQVPLQLTSADTAREVIVPHAILLTCVIRIEPITSVDVLKSILEAREYYSNIEATMFKEWNDLRAKRVSKLN